AVEHDRELPRLATGQRVRVLLCDAAVGRPACVPQAGLRRRRMPVRGSDEVVERPYRARVDELVCFEHGDPGGVVATVLEALQALQQQRLGGPTADVS